MFQDNYPRFASGVVLKADMLGSMSEYQRNMFKILCSNNSDGIVAGAELTIQNTTTIAVSPGIIKHKGKLYHQYDTQTVKANPSSEMQYLKVHFDELQEKSDTICQESSLVLDIEEPDSETDMELCRFILDKGSVLRNSYIDLRDYSTLHDTINVIETPYSAEGDTSTFSPAFLLEYAREMFKYPLTDAAEIYFVMECLKEKPVKREIILKYISRRLSVQKAEMTNQEIYRNLLRIVDLAKRGEAGSAAAGARNGVRRMIVD